MIRAISVCASTRFLAIVAFGVTCPRSYYHSKTQTARSIGGDFTDRIAGKCVTLKAAEAGKEMISDVTFVVMDWISGRLANNGLILVPSQEDLSSSAATYGFESGSMKLIIECTE